MLAKVNIFDYSKSFQPWYKTLSNEKKSEILKRYYSKGLEAYHNAYREISVSCCGKRVQFENRTKQNCLKCEADIMDCVSPFILSLYSAYRGKDCRAKIAEAKARYSQNWQNENWQKRSLFELKIKTRRKLKEKLEDLNCPLFDKHRKKKSIYQ